MYNMKKMAIKNTMLALATLLALASCEKKLDIPSRNSLDAGIALSNKSGIENSINSIYSILKRETHYGRDLFSITDAMADIAFANGRSSRLLSENRNQALANILIWAGSYAAINEINLTLAAYPLLSDATDAEKARWEGELKFLRALYLFDLVKNYAYIPTFTVPAQDKGGVVISLTGFNSASGAVAYFPSRSSTAACYEQIMQDLYRAIALLSNANKGRNYASKHAALALGSRVTLYQGNWVRSDSFATAAITITGGIGSMTNTANYVTGWRAADHPEGIFQVWYATLAENLGVNTSLAATHTTLSAPGALTGVRQGQGDLVPNAFLLGQLGITGFPANLAQSPPAPALTYGNDIRNRLFEWGVNASGHYVECTKWMGKSGGPNWDNSVVLRWPELYLNRAEARYRRGDEPGAWADLNVIRTARIVGFTVPATPLTGQALLDEIWRQRMLEFAFEGHRFYDLKRNGLAINKTNPAVLLPANDYRLLPRIPQSEVDGNTNMVQNFGY
jgi:starch-binding outer membrane protein, SusD/RagB family